METAPPPWGREPRLGSSRRPRAWSARRRLRIFAGMHGSALLIRTRRAVTPEGVRPVLIRIAGGVIRAVEPLGPGEGVGPTAWRPSEEPPPTGEAALLDVGEAVVMPGLVDTHVHVNDPGRADWEGFGSAGRAAAAGGITTIVDMPLNSSPVTTDVEALERKLRAAEGSCRVDYALWGGLVPGSVGELPSLLEAGVSGVKCFLADSGIDEFPPVGEAEARAGMEVLSQWGAPLLVHAESAAVLARVSVEDDGADAGSYARYLASRPPEAEVEAVELVLRLSAETGCPVHVVHLSAADALEPVAAARRSGIPVTVETCPHYLTFAAEEIADGATEFKCAPPIREEANRARLWNGLADGLIDQVASDHSPAPPAMKRGGGGDFLAAWGGIASLQLLLPAVWSAARGRGHDLPRLATWVCEAPARLAGLGARKGRLAPGFDADLVIWEPERAFVVRGEALHHRHPQTPYQGRTLHGRVLRTFLRGVQVFDGTGAEPAFPPARPSGRWLPRAA